MEKLNNEKNKKNKIDTRKDKKNNNKNTSKHIYSPFPIRDPKIKRLLHFAIWACLPLSRTWSLCPPPRSLFYTWSLMGAGPPGWHCTTRAIWPPRSTYWPPISHLTASCPWAHSSLSRPMFLSTSTEYSEHHHHPMRYSASEHLLSAMVSTQHPPPTPSLWPHWSWHHRWRSRPRKVLRLFPMGASGLASRAGA